MRLRMFLLLALVLCSGVLLSQMQGPGQSVVAGPLPSCDINGTLSTDTTLTPDCVWRTSGLTVPNGITLTLEPGTILKVNMGDVVTVYGQMISNGTGASPVIITSLRDDSIGGDTNGDGGATVPLRGDWYYIRPNGDATLSLTETVLRYAGGDSGAIYNSSGTAAISLTNGTAEQSATSGIYMGVSTGSLHVSNTTIQNNAAQGLRSWISNTGEAVAVISSSSLLNNGSYGILNSASSGEIDARLNWWGDASGPSSDGQGCNTATGTGDVVSCRVLFDPWLGSTPEDAATVFSLTETTSSESLPTEDVEVSQASINDATISGDLTGVVDFSSFEMVTVETGPFAGRGFATGEWAAELSGVPYAGRWQAAAFFVPEDGLIHFRGALSGDIRGITDGTLALPSGDYHTTWTLNRVGTNLTTAVLEVDGAVAGKSSTDYPGTQLRIYQASMSGSASGHYEGPMSATVTEVRIQDVSHPNDGQGWASASYTTSSGQGEWLTHDEMVTPGRVELGGSSSGPLTGPLSAILDENAAPKTLSGSIGRLDLGARPEPRLRASVLALQAVSPGQTIEYIVDFRNDGLATATGVALTLTLDPAVTYVSTAGGGYYDALLHEVSWQIGELAPQESGHVAVTTEVVWGLPAGTTLSSSAWITQLGFGGTSGASWPMSGTPSGGGLPERHRI